MTQHPRVRHVRELRQNPLGVYIGRGPCPCRDPGCGHRVEGDFGNPFPIDPERPWLSMVHFLDMLGALTLEHVAHIRATLRGKLLFCYCRGKYAFCHGDPLARLADGEELDAIRLDILRALGIAA